jgi:hypothetical protein
VKYADDNNLAVTVVVVLGDKEISDIVVGRRPRVADSGLLGVEIVCCPKVEVVVVVSHQLARVYVGLR